MGKRPRLTKEAAERGRALGNAALMEKANAFAKAMATRIRELEAEGLSLNAIAKRFNADGVPTARGKVGSWTPATAARVLARADELEEATGAVAHALQKSLGRHPIQPEPVMSFEDILKNAEWKID